MGKAEALARSAAGSPVIFILFNLTCTFLFLNDMTIGVSCVIIGSLFSDVLGLIYCGLDRYKHHLLVKGLTYLAAYAICVAWYFISNAGLMEIEFHERGFFLTVVFPLYIGAQVVLSLASFLGIRFLQIRQKRSPINFVAEKKILVLYGIILSLELILNLWIHQRFDIIPEKENLGYFDRNPLFYEYFFRYVYEKWGVSEYLFMIYFVVPIVAIIRSIFRKSYYNSLILFLSFITIGITTRLYAYGPGTFCYYYPFPSLLGLIGITLICSYLYYKKNINIQNRFYFFLTLLFMSVMRIAYYVIVIDFMKLHET